MTTATTAPAGKPKRERKPPAPMTATKAIADIVKVRAKAEETEQGILEQLEPADRKRVIAFLAADNEAE